MKDIHVRPYEDEDRQELDEYRQQYQPADLEIPHGYVSENVQTVIAYKEGKLTVGSLTGILAIVLDPAIMNPAADPIDKMKALTAMEDVLTYLGRKTGAIDSYVAIPNALVATYGKILEKCGYEPTVQNCTVYRRPLVPETEPLIGPARDAASPENNS